MGGRAGGRQRASAAARRSPSRLPFELPERAPPSRRSAPSRGRPLRVLIVDGGEPPPRRSSATCARGGWSPTWARVPGRGTRALQRRPRGRALRCGDPRGSAADEDADRLCRELRERPVRTAVFVVALLDIGERLADGSARRGFRRRDRQADQAGAPLRRARRRIRPSQPRRGGRGRVAAVADCAG